MSIKEKIINEYGSINNFIEKKYDKIKELGLSRTNIYRILNNDSHSNITVGTVKKLAELLGCPEEEVFNEYSTRYRNTRQED